jgi:hypothetical protein
MGIQATCQCPCLMHFNSVTTHGACSYVTRSRETEVCGTDSDACVVMMQVSAGAGEMTGGVFLVAAVLGVGAIALNALSPTLLPSPEDLGKPEARAEAKRLAALEKTFSSGGDDEDSEKDAVLASANRSRKDA